MRESIRTFGRTIEIGYWHSKLPNTPWEQNEKFETISKKKFRKKLYKILSRIEDAGYNAMVMHHKHCYTTTVFICDGRFRQS